MLIRPPENSFCHFPFIVPRKGKTEKTGTRIELAGFEENLVSILNRFSGPCNPQGLQEQSGIFSFAKGKHAKAD